MELLRNAFLSIREYQVLTIDYKTKERYHLNKVVSAWFSMVSFNRRRRYKAPNDENEWRKFLRESSFLGFVRSDFLASAPNAIFIHHHSPRRDAQSARDFWIYRPTSEDFIALLRCRFHRVASSCLLAFYMIERVAVARYEPRGTCCLIFPDSNLATLRVIFTRVFSSAVSYTFCYLSLSFAYHQILADYQNMEFQRIFYEILQSNMHRK